MTNTPNKIYLVVGDDLEDTSFKELTDITWCEDRIESNDIAYVSEQFLLNLFSRRIEEIDEFIKLHSEATMSGQKQIHRLRGIKKIIKELTKEIQAL